MPKRKPARRRPAKKSRPSKPRRRSRAAPAESPGLSLRGFARRLGVNLWAVQKAVASGRLDKSLARGKRGGVSIGDVDLAMREWADNASQQPSGGTNGDGLGSLSEAQRRVAVERERKLRIDNLQREGRLIDRAKVERDSFEIARTVRESVLAVSPRISPQLAAETDAGRVHQMLEAELRVALVSLAEAFADDRPSPGGHVVHGDGGDDAVA